jgi:hypothetical protein
MSLQQPVLPTTIPGTQALPEHGLGLHFINTVMTGSPTPPRRQNTLRMTKALRS